MRALPGSSSSRARSARSPLSPPPEVVSTAVALLVECAVACGALEVEVLVASLEHAVQVGRLGQLHAHMLKKSALQYAWAAIIR